MKDKGSSFYNIVLLFLSVYVLGAIIIESFFVTDAEIKKVLQYIDFLVCVFFLLDFLINFCSAKSKLQYMKWGWLDLVSSIPAIDPLRWGRVSKIVRIVRYLRTIKSIKVLLKNLHSSKFETLSLCVFLVVFLTFTLSAAVILEFERDYDSPISTAETAIWWAFLNILNAKSSITQALSAEGVAATIILNKVGLLFFAYLNSMLVAWLVLQRKQGSTKNATVMDEGE
jgi:voltage-gated potassium channel